MNQPHKKRNKQRRQLWGRAQGRPLSPYQMELMETIFPNYKLSLDKALHAFLSKYEKRSLEIGFGNAGHLLHRAKENPNTLYIGVDPYLNGVAKAVVGIHEARIKNIRLHHGDVRDVFSCLRDASLDEIYILYPDPWPKTRHYKRRLIQEQIISEFYRSLKLSAPLYFASDIVSYVDWALARILRYKTTHRSGFIWEVENCADWLTPYPTWPSTRYEAKAIREGRTPHYFTFLKR
ncbi:MAG: tRNA (guanosine(46)-N(7))-methyltransferase TrmB [Robiginitomaculum sp.]